MGNTGSEKRFDNSGRWSVLTCLLFVLLLGGCASEMSVFHEQADVFGRDGSIDQGELGELLELISAEEGEFPRFLNEHGAVDTSNVVNYLERYFTKHFAGTDNVEIWRPDSTAASPKFNVNVFVENSASMDGYVKGVTDFETAMYNLLADIKLSQFCDSLNLNYINSEVRKNRTNALPPDIEDFISKLEPTDFKTRGGDRGTTDIKEVLRKVLRSVDDRNMAVLISDFVFSPGKDKDATEYLEQQQIGIRIDITQKRESMALAVAVIQLESQFDGVYYDKNNTSISIAGSRPYYVWLIGSGEQIREIRSADILKRLRNRMGYKNMALFKDNKNGLALRSGVQHARWKEGMFDRDVRNGITGAEWDRETRHFGFSIAVEMSGTWQEEGYLADTANYHVENPRYGIRGVRQLAINDPLHGRYSHLLEVRTLRNEPLRSDEVVRIDLMARMPEWVLDCTSLDDIRIASDSTQMGRTFGLKYLMEGLYGAFYPDLSSPLASINVSIKRK